MRRVGLCSVLEGCVTSLSHGNILNGCIFPSEGMSYKPLINLSQTLRVNESALAYVSIANCDLWNSYFLKLTVVYKATLPIML